MSRRFIIVPQSAVEELKDIMDNCPSSWDRFDLVIVRDEDYENCVTEVDKVLPPDVSLREYELPEKR